MSEPLKPLLPVIGKLSDTGSATLIKGSEMTPKTDAQALDSIRTTWLQWAKTEIDNEEAFARIAEALEQSGRGVILPEE